jgi:hypothetical protein
MFSSEGGNRREWIAILIENAHFYVSLSPASLFRFKGQVAQFNNWNEEWNWAKIYQVEYSPEKFSANKFIFEKKKKELKVLLGVISSGADQVGKVLKS